MPRLATVLRLAVLLALAAFLVAPGAFAPLFEPFAAAGRPPVYAVTSLLSLAVSHLAIVALATGLATLVAVAVAILVTRPAGREFLPLMRGLANLGQTFPPIAVLALAVPALGFGATPTLVALFLYGLLPVFESTLAGFTGAPADVLDAADGMGMTPAERLLRVELPLALPVMLAGVRVSAVVAMGTATIGSTVGAPTLGEPIVAGLLSGNLAFVLEGALVAAVLAVLVSDALWSLERRLGRR
jgi:osmoprotectant transport system permease protein